MATQQITTAEQLFRTPTLGRCELVRGELFMMTPSGFEHGRIVARLSARLASFVERQALGTVIGAETGFQIAHDPDTVRAPDVAFVRADRVPDEPTTGFFHGAPDLAVEVLSPNDRASDLFAKVQDWLGAGCRAVWVVDPVTHTVSVYRSPSEVVVCGVSEQVTGDDVVPDFTLPVAEIFAA